MKEILLANISRGLAHVWTLPVDQFDDAGSGLWREILCEEETARFEKIVLEQNRREYLAAHALTRVMLSHFSDFPPSEWRFVAGKHGRPELSEKFEYTALRFNLSHVRGMVACALTRVDDIGVDVEWLERSNSFAKIAERKFSQPEVDYFNSVGKEDRRRAFFSYWTLKESYIKAIGRGLVEPLDGFAFSLDPLEISFLRENGNSDCWNFCLFEASAEHLCAVSVARSAGATVEISKRSLNWEELESLAQS